MTQSSVDDPVEIIRLHHMEPLKLPRSFRVTRHIHSSTLRASID